MVQRIEFPIFSIEFELRVSESVQFTNRFSHYGNDFVYLVVDIWLSINGIRKLVISESNPSNLIEDFRLISTMLVSISFEQDLVGHINLGGWRKWFVGYWNRLYSDETRLDDDDLYEKLISYSILSSESGDIALYLYDGVPTIEVTVNKGDLKEESVFTTFLPPELLSEMQRVELGLRAELRES